MIQNQCRQGQDLQWKFNWIISNAKLLKNLVAAYLSNNPFSKGSNGEIIVLSYPVHEESWNVICNADNPYQKGNVSPHLLAAIVLGFQWVIQVNESVMERKCGTIVWAEIHPLLWCCEVLLQIDKTILNRLISLQLCVLK